MRDRSAGPTSCPQLKQQGYGDIEHDCEAHRHRSLSALRSLKRSTAANPQLRPSNRSTHQTGFREPAGEAVSVLRPQRSAADVFVERILWVDLLELSPYAAGLVDLT
jgi:hypothetical protein